MQYTQLPVEPFKSIAFDAGIIASEFSVKTGVLERSKILFATSGGSQFNPNLATSDLFEDMDNAKTGTKQGYMITGCDPHLTTTVLTVDEKNIDTIMANSTTAKLTDTTAEGIDVYKTTLHDGMVDSTSFKDLWIITNYGTMTTASGSTQNGFFVIHMKNCINVTGFQQQTAKDGKVTYSVDFKAFYDTEDISTVPYEIYFSRPTPVSE